MTNPFFSIIIATHNSENFIERTLSSIVMQDFKSLEVIIADDDSTDSTLKKIKKFKKLLNLKIYKAHTLHHYPGETKQCGLEHATGDWVTFMDHDDILLPFALGNIENAIFINQCKYVCIGQFETYVTNGNSIDSSYNPELSFTWLHGKFYNRKNLIEKYNLSFNKNIFGLEDLWFNNCAYINLLNDYNLKLMDFCISIPVYAWIKHGQNITMQEGYLERSFTSYLEANFTPVFNVPLKDLNNLSDLKESLTGSILFAYFYYSHLFDSREDENTEIKKLFKEIINKFLKYTNMTKEEFFTYVLENDYIYYEILNIARNQESVSIPKKSFQDFINEILEEGTTQNE